MEIMVSSNNKGGGGAGLKLATVSVDEVVVKHITMSTQKSLGR